MLPVRSDLMNERVLPVDLGIIRGCSQARDANQTRDANTVAVSRSTNERQCHKEVHMSVTKSMRACLAVIGMIAAAVVPVVVQADTLGHSSLISQMDTSVSGCASQHPGCDVVDNCCDTWSGFDSSGVDSGGECCSRAFYVGYESTILRPSISDRGGTGYNAEFGAGNRFILGAQNTGGVGLRTRYWLFNHGHDFAPPSTDTWDLDMDVLDFELTLGDHFANWDALVSGGLRYGRLNLRRRSSEVTLEGVGPTISAQAIRKLGFRGLHAIGNLRGSLLQGDIDNSGGLLNGASQINDESTLVLENQLGIGWSRAGKHADQHVRVLWETQFWMNDTINDDTNAIRSNLGLGGVTIALELRR